MSKNKVVVGVCLFWTTVHLGTMNDISFYMPINTDDNLP